MARFKREYLDTNVSAGEAWGKITKKLQTGTKSVEVRSRVIDGIEKWELRYWDGIRGNGARSNSSHASPDKDY